MRKCTGCDKTFAVGEFFFVFTFSAQLAQKATPQKVVIVPDEGRKEKRIFCIKCAGDWLEIVDEIMDTADEEMGE